MIASRMPLACPTETTAQNQPVDESATGEDCPVIRANMVFLGTVLGRRLRVVAVESPIERGFPQQLAG